MRFLFWSLRFSHHKPHGAVDDAKRRLARIETMTAPAIETQNLSKQYPHGFLHLKKKPRSKA